jgi:hypothetical protein
MNFLVRAAQVLVNATWRATHRSKPTEKAIPGAYPVGGHGGWIGLIRESFPGAWQRNVTVSVDTALTYSAVFRCISLISSDIAKMRIKLVRLTDAGVWEETENPAFPQYYGHRTAGRPITSSSLTGWSPSSSMVIPTF